MLHDDELPAGVDVVRRLLHDQRPDLTGLALTPVGGGTDNTMYRLGPDLLVRLPRAPGNAESLRTELVWLPRLGPLLPLDVPEPVHAGEPVSYRPLPWAIYRWIDGVQPGATTVRDWSAYGADLGRFVRDLHALDPMGARRGPGLDGYRGGVLQDLADELPGAFAELRAVAGDRVDVGVLQRIWDDALRLPEPAGPPVWLHGDLKPTNLLVRDGRLAAVLDFGGLTIGHPDAEHAVAWGLHPDARAAYRSAAGVDDLRWARARAWAVAIDVLALPYYWHTYPGIVAESLARVDAVCAEVA